MLEYDKYSTYCRARMQAKVNAWHGSMGMNNGLDHSLFSLYKPFYFFNENTLWSYLDSWICFGYVYLNATQLYWCHYTILVHILYIHASCKRKRKHLRVVVELWFHDSRKQDWNPGAHILKIKMTVHTWLMHKPETFSIFYIKKILQKLKYIPECVLFIPLRVTTKLKI